MEVRISENNDYIVIDNIYQIKIVGTFETPYFNAVDVCNMLGYFPFDRSSMEKILQKKITKICRL